MTRHSNVPSSRRRGAGPRAKRRGQRRGKSGSGAKVFFVALGLALAVFGAFFLLIVLRKGPPRLVEKVASFVPGMTATVVVPEGQSSFQIGERLEGAGICLSSDFLLATRDRETLVEFGIQAASAEGYLFPATYELLTDEDPKIVVRRMLEVGVARRAGLSFASAPEVQGARLEPHAVLTLASIVEKETGVSEERGKIARVFLNRLNAPSGTTGARLESDPTAAYGCRALDPPPASCVGFTGRITPELLRDATNPYNSYRNAGLPPGPIGNPGLAAIEAVLSPPPGEELFFVANGAGKHTFSRTYEEHLAAVARLRGQAKRP